MLKHRERGHQSPDGGVTEADELVPLGSDVWEVDEPRAGATFGAAFFGWLVAAAVTALIVAIVGAVSAIVGLSELEDWLLSADRTTFVLVGGGLFIATMVIGLFAGGYVAGRMVRSHGARQGLGVWFFGLLVLAMAGVAVYAAEQEYEFVARVDWPATPFTGGPVTTTEIVLMSLAALATLAAAVIGGRTGNSYHQRFDIS
jgi:hypothetical protein